MNLDEIYLKQLNNYCKMARFDEIPGAGDLVFRQVTLESLYFPLNLTKEQHEGESFEEMLAQKTVGTQGSIKKNQQYRRVIVGDPGCGKTTFCKRICLAYAHSELEGLEYTVDDSETIKKYSLPEGAFPVLLTCRALNSAELQPELDFYQIAYRITREMFPELTFSCDQFKEMLQAKEETAAGLMIIVDGMDELLDKGLPDAFSNAFCKYIDSGFRPDKTSGKKFIATVRSASAANAEKLQRLHDTQTYRIAPLTDSEVGDFCRIWYKVVLNNASGRKHDPELIIEQLMEPNAAAPFLHTLMRNPLQLSNLLIVTRFTGKIPDTKNRLYEEYLDLVLKWNPSQNTSWNPVDIKILLAYIAAYMTNAEHTKISAAELSETLERCFVDLEGKFVRPMDGNTIPLILRELEERNCVLQRKDPEGPFEFTHRQLQEYLTLYAILYGYADQQTNNMYPIEILRCHYNDISWQEIIGMAAMTEDTRLTGNLVSEILVQVEQNAENGTGSNAALADIVFNWILCGVKIDQSRRLKIYDTVFKASITEQQITGIALLMSRKDTAIREEFTERIGTRYRENCLEDNWYGFAYAAIEACRCYNSGENPLTVAEQMLAGQDQVQQCTAMNLLQIMSWCKYARVSTTTAEFHSSDEYCVSEETVSRLINCIENPVCSRCPLAAKTLRDLLLAQYIPDDMFRRQISLEKLFSAIPQDPENKSVGPASARELLSVYPFEVDEDANVVVDAVPDQQLKQYYENLFEKQLEAAATQEEEKENLIFTFNACAVLGAWETFEKYMSAFQSLYAIYRGRSRESDYGVLFNKLVVKVLNVLVEQLSEKLPDAQKQEKPWEQEDFQEQNDEQEFTFTVTDEQGNEVEMEIILTFDSVDPPKSYVVYTDNTKDPEDGKIRVYASSYTEHENDSMELHPIETESEWEIVQTVLNKLEKDIRESSAE